MSQVIGEVKPLKAVSKSNDLVKIAIVSPIKEAAPMGKTPNITRAMVPKKMEKSCHEAPVNPSGVGKR